MTAQIPIRDSGPMATHLLADADGQNDNLRRSFRARPAGQLWDRLAEYEAPEADPAEADPTEAEPDLVVTLVDGVTYPAQMVHEGRVLATVNTPVGLAVVTIDELNRWNPNRHCPIHGAGCEAWA